LFSGEDEDEDYCVWSPWLNNTDLGYVRMEGLPILAEWIEGHIATLSFTAKSALGLSDRVCAAAFIIQDIHVLRQALDYRRNAKALKTEQLKPLLAF